MASSPITQSSVVTPELSFEVRYQQAAELLDRIKALRDRASPTQQAIIDTLLQGETQTIKTRTAEMRTTNKATACKIAAAKEKLEHLRKKRQALRLSPPLTKELSQETQLLREALPFLDCADDEL